ncbi:MAG: hypothetical protein JOY54_00485 [Acidobacteriaceae bacterium]|nr:hypothetical protein [Acidobacteriaceae bacterium]
MKTINRADYVIQSQVPFGEMLDKFLRGHAGKVGYVARCKHELLIKNHILQQHFLRPVAKQLGFYWKGFGFRSLRREAITAIGSIAGIGQAMKVAGYSRADTSLLYTLHD